MRIRGWTITGITAALLAAIVLVTWSTHGFTEEFVRVNVRATARVSVTLFLLAFSASSLRALYPSQATNWLLQNRRYLGVSFALSHFVHLGVLLLLGMRFPHPFLDDLAPITLIGGGLAYVFITLMTVTSFAAPRHLIGERAWKILHTTGSYYVWLIFFNSYAPRAVQDAAYVPLALALLAALALRIARRIRLRTAAAGPKVTA